MPNKPIQDIRSEALERAVYYLAHQQVEQYSAPNTVAVAKRFEKYLVDGE